MPKMSPKPVKTGWLIKKTLDEGEGRKIGLFFSVSFAVVDGQQRLTTLFLLAHILYQHWNQGNPQYNRTVFEVQPLVGQAIPRLIQGNAQDHQFMMQIVDHVWNSAQPLPVHQNAAQDRMLQSFTLMRGWVNQPWAPFLTSPNFRVLRVLLDPAYGLIAFMTLNDRGKDLTILEKLKALLLQFVYDAYRASVPGAAPLITQLHNDFGDLYRVVDRCTPIGLLSQRKADDEAVKLISCYVRLETDADAIWQGPDQAYAGFFRARLLNAAVANIPAIVQPWCDRIQELVKQLDELVDRIAGNAPYGVIGSLHFNGFKLQDDYHATLISLGLQPHLLALLLRFRVQTGADWHQRFPVPANAFPLAPIHAMLDDIRARARGIQPPMPST